MDEHEAMQRALVLASEGWGKVHPNPLVGAVLLRDGQVIAEAAHREYGGAHAEAAALQAAPDARGTTCVVTLEPCAHHGKTPPCAEALIEAGVQRVVYAVGDPGIAAGGADRLRAAGIEVGSGLLGAEAAALNARFLAVHERPDRPWVALKVATSLDGFLADRQGRSRWISGQEARAYVQWLRAGFDGIGVGRGTVVTDDPELTVRGPIVPRKPPIRVVFTRSGAIDAERSVVRSAGAVPTLILVDPTCHDRATATLMPHGVEVIPADGLDQAMRRLRERGIEALLVEGGGGLARALLAANLVDRLYWVQAPVLLGGGVSAFGFDPVTLEAARRWHVVARRPLGEDTLLVCDRESCLPAS